MNATDCNSPACESLEATIPRSSRYWMLGLVLVILGGVLSPWDAQFSGAFRMEKIPGDLARIVALSEAFAHGSTVFIILFSLWWIDRRNRPWLLWASYITIAGGVTANLSKSIFTRIRPHAMEHIEAGQTQAGWMPIWSGSFWEATHRSFPSGHSATAIALACGLGVVYPRGRWIFAVLGILACFQRIASGAHYPSDAFAGAAIGCFATAIACLFCSRAATR